MRSEARTAQIERQRLGRVRVAGLAGGLLAALALLLLGPERTGNGLFDAYQRTRPRTLSPDYVRIVDIDSESLRLIGPWPWSRYDLARLTERIGAAGAKAIGFDMFFPEVDRQTPRLFVQRYPELTPAARAEMLRLPSMDAAFAEVLGRHPTVLARAGAVETSTDNGEPLYRDAATLPVEAKFSAALPAGVQSWPQAISSIPELEETSLGHGLINGDPDDDGVVRRVPMVGSLHGAANSGFALELARIWLGADTVRPIIRGGTLRAIAIGPRVIPTEPDGRIRLHFGTVPAERTLSAAAILGSGFDPRTLAGKIVVISVTGAGGTDVVTTPLAPQAYGIDVQAQAIDAILSGEWLQRPAWAAAVEFALGALLTLIAVLLFPRLRGVAAFAVPLALTLCMIAASWIAFAGSGLLLDPLIPLLIGGAAGLAVLIALFVETGLLGRRLRAALFAERVSVARATGELEAARDIQQGMLPSQASLARLDPAIDIDALLEPARAVGGDFFDAFALGDGRTAFLIGDVTGKGVPAALFMALSKALTRSTVMGRRDDIGAAMGLLSAELSSENAQDMFVTMLLGIADGRTGEIGLINAGHENPLVIRSDGTVSEFAMEGGPPLCVMDDFPYRSEPLRLGPGDGLVIVTDGVTEAQDPDGVFFDRGRAIAELRALPAGWAASDATTAILRAVRMFEDGGEPSDDLTVLALRMHDARGVVSG